MTLRELLEGYGPRLRGPEDTTAVMGELIDAAEAWTPTADDLALLREQPAEVLAATAGAFVIGRITHDVEHDE